MDHRRTEQFYAIVSPGLEQACADELRALGLGSVQPEPGGVTFSGRLADLYRANLESRLASRILVRFAGFRCRDFPKLYQQAVRLPWGRFMRGETAVSLRVTCRGSRLNHSGRVAETLTEAVNRALGRSSNPKQAAPQLVLARIVDDLVQLSIDSSGALLHRRGYRQDVTMAPLRETLAAGVLRLLDWNGTEPLYDPMCGTGSFLLEGAMIAGRRAPGLERPFSFMQWPGWREGLWTQLCQQARREEVEISVEITGADRDPEAVAAARANSERLALQRAVSIWQLALESQPTRDDSGLLVCNPPYGQRLVPDDLTNFYRIMGRDLQRAFPGWRKALICPDIELIRAAGLGFEQIATLDNGGLSVGLFVTPPG